MRELNKILCRSLLPIMELWWNREAVSTEQLEKLLRGIGFSSIGKSQFTLL